MAGQRENGKLTLGARYSKDDVERSGVFKLPLFGVAIPSDNTYSGSKATWNVGYDYTLSPSQLLYGKVSSGYKPGGFESCANYNPENVTTSELGSKNRFDGGRVELNGAAFYSQYKDQQVQQFVSTCPTGSVTTNAGKSTIYGLEAEFKAVLADNNRIDVGLTYLHTLYNEFNVPPTVAALVDPVTKQDIAGTGGLASCVNAKAGDHINCDFSGNTLPVSPKVTLAAGFEHDFVTESGKVNVRVEGRYTSKQYFDPSNYGDMQQDSYTLINAFLSYRHDNWSLGLFGRNLADKTYLNYAAENTTGGAHQYGYSYGYPRTYGVRAELHIK